MNQDLSSIGRILVGPWQQRRSQGGLWGLALIALLCMLTAVAVGVVSGGSARSYAVVSIAVLGMGMLGGWAFLVLNVLEQNHPTFARLVPRHVGRLRATLVMAWMALVALAAVAATAFGSPTLAWATAVA
ncbi:MAG: hypothetical protein ABJD97_14650, partial [Betaproteobacteria bacterium]